MNKFDVITRGFDTSGRVIRGTRQAFQHFDRVNEKVGGKLVIVQGAFVSGTAASAGTHDQAGCFDIRTWNLTSDERYAAIREARRLGAAAWYRHQGQGFDPHMHWVLIGDAPMASLATAQIDMYRKGYNGLGWYAQADDFPWRPKTITAYKFLEDDMFDAAAEKKINDKLDHLTVLMQREHKRDKREQSRDAQRYQRLVGFMGEQIDALTILINRTENDVSKKDLNRLKNQMLAALDALAEDGDVDKPSSETMADVQ